MKRRVYVETTIPSYLTSRRSRDLIRAARQELTLEWWEDRRRDFEIYISQMVVDEAGRGDSEAAQRRLACLAGIPRLEVTAEAQEVAQGLLDRGAIPREAAEDALHVALAAVHGMDFLLTWNCSHIANAERAGPIREAVRGLGYECPTICTPEELLGTDR